MSISVCTSTVMETPIRGPRTNCRLAASRHGGEERLGTAAGEVAGEPLKDKRPGLGGVSQVYLGVPVSEAVVPEQHVGPGLGTRGCGQLPFPGRALPERK